MEWLVTIRRLRSERASDRNRGIRALTALLDSDEDMKTLASAEMMPSVGMNEVFMALHQLVVKEALGMQTKECRKNTLFRKLMNRKDKFNSLMRNLLHKSGNDENMKIKIENLANSLAEVFQRTYLRENFGGSYFTSILKIILSRRSYWSEMYSKQWKDFIKTGIVAYNDCIKLIDKPIVAKAITHLISRSCVYTEINLWLPSKTTFFETALIAATGESKHNQECSLMMAVILSKVIAKDHRGVLAKFGENVMEAVLSMYDYRTTDTDIRKCLTLEFMQLQMTVHHPLGSRGRSLDAYADDWYKWSRLLEMMYFKICEEIDYVHRSHGHHEEKICRRFVDMSVDVIYQLTKISEQDICVEVGDLDFIPEKRIKRELGLFVILQSLKERSKNSAVWPWLAILNTLLTKYNDCLPETEYLNFLDTMFQLLTSSRDGLIMSYAFKCCSSLAKAKKPSFVSKEQYISAWQKIWDLALRTIGLNLYEDPTHETICTLVDKIHPEKQVADVLNMYISGCIVVSTPSVKTLWCLLSKFQMVDTMEQNVRVNLLKWMLPSKPRPSLMEKPYPAKIFAGLLVRLCIQGNLKILLMVKDEKVVGQLDELYQKLNFCAGLLIPRPSEKVEDLTVSHEQLSAEEDSLLFMKEMISNEVESMISWIKDLRKGEKVPSQGFQAAELMSHWLSLLALISSYLLEWKIVNLTTLMKFGFPVAFEMLYNSLTDLLVDLFIEYEDSTFRLSGILKKLKELYDLPLSHEVNKFIKEHTPHQAINLLMNIIKERPVDNDEEFHRKTVTRYFKTDVEPYVYGSLDSYVDCYTILNPNILRENDSIKVIACEVMGSFSCAQADHLIIPLQRQVITQILTKLPQEYSKNFPVFFQMFIGFINEPINRGAMDLVYIDCILNVLQNIVMKYPKDLEIFRSCLSTLEHISQKNFNGTNTIDITVKHCPFYVREIEKFGKEKLPSSIMVAIIKTISAIAKTNFSMTYDWLGLTEEKGIEIGTYLLQEMDCHYYEVRLAVAENVWPMFCKLRNAQLDSRPILSKWLKHITGSCPEVGKSPLDCDKNNVKCAIHCLSVIAITIPYYRKEALYQILKLFIGHELSKEIGQRVFCLISQELKLFDPKQLIKEYILFLIDKWLMNGTIKDFPYWLTNETMKEFLIENKALVFSILWIMNHSCLKDFCKEVERTVPEMLREYYANVLAFTLKRTVLNLDTGKSEVMMRTTRHVIEELMRVYPEETLFHILSTKENSVLYNVYRLLYDDQEIRTASSNIMLVNRGLIVCVPESNPYCYSKAMIKQSLLWINSSAGNTQEHSFIYYLVKEAPSHLRHVISCLAKDAIHAPTSSDSYICVISFETFVNMVAETILEVEKELTGHISKVWTGLIRDVCFTYVRIMRRSWWNDDDVVRTTAFFYLKTFLMGFGMNIANVLEKVLIPFIGALVDLIEENLVKSLENDILNLLETLFEKETLRETLVQICPFPAKEKYLNLNIMQRKLRDIQGEASLIEELNYFMKLYNSYGLCKCESLLHLQNMFKTKKADLKKLYEKLEMKKGSYNKYKDDPFHKVVCFLSKLCASSDYKIGSEAAKCLAELGSGDLKVPVLVTERFTLVEATSESMESNMLNKLTMKCLELLPKYLLDNDIEVVEAASSGLQAILNSREGEVSQEIEVPWQLKLADDYTIKEKTVVIELNSSPLEFSEARFNRTTELWIPTEGCSHSKWMTSLVEALLQCFHSNSSYLESITEICSHKVPLCEELFPFILEVLLRCGELSSHSILFKRIRKFFAASYDSFIYKSKGIKTKKDTMFVSNKASIITMLDAVNFLNLQHLGLHSKYRSHNYEDTCTNTSIDYLHCAVVAQNCSAYFSAIQYCTLWLSRNSRGNEPHSLKFHIDSSTLHVNEILQVLRESYAGIGDRDALYGCGTSHLLEPEGRIQHFKHIEKWEQVMRSYELELTNCGPRDNIDGLLYAMQMVGMEELLMGLIDKRDSEDLLQYKYECGWRLGSWDLLSKFSERRKRSSSLELMNVTSRIGYLEGIDEDEVNKEFHRNLFLSLHYVKTGKYLEAVNSTKIARSCVIDSLSLASLEACQNLNKPITRLRALKEVEEFATAFMLEKNSAIPTILEQWENADSIGDQCLKAVEPVKAVRLTLLEYCCGDIPRDSDGLISGDHPAIAPLIEYRLDLGHIAREERMYSVSEKYLRAVRQIQNTHFHVKFSSRLEVEEAKLFWARGDRDIAKNIISNIITTLDPLLLDKASYLCYTGALTTFGYWMMETHSESSKVTLLNYFGRACELLDNDNYRQSEEYFNALKALSVFADQQFILTMKYLSSSSYTKKRNCAIFSRKMIADYKGKRNLTKEEKDTLVLLEKQAELDESELCDIESEKISYLNIALNYYIKFLTLSNNTQLEIVFRLVSLMMEETDMKEALERQMKLIPSYKLIPVMPQLLTKMQLAKGSTSAFLRELIEKCARDHPHHVLPAIFAVAYSLKDLGKSKDSEALIASPQKCNAKAAQNMLSSLRKNEDIKNYIIQLEILWEALIQLASIPVNKMKQKVAISAEEIFSKVKNLEYVQIPTLELPASPVGEYKHIISVWKYIPEFCLVGGINKPKKLICIGSDGVRYQQLLKGNDDLYQDAVMQQLFKLMNNLLEREQESRKRGLVMRTYKVVPLSHRSGVIEWYENAISIGSYLYGCDGKFGAHASYNPTDYSVRKCQQMLRNVERQSNAIRLQVYLEICENIQPVFRHYFSSKFPNPGIWYEMRQAYTRSLATSSIIGYVVGLGDRHLENILIDKLTSQVIHIDLGIAFEKGKAFVTPETVPFRLTRDIVDGMGISGVEGVFRRSCEVTMEVMRKYRQPILAVLEVLLYDPLYGWTLKPKWKAMDVNSSSTEDEESQCSLLRTSESGHIPSGDGIEARAGPSVHEVVNSDEGKVEKNTIAERALERIDHKLIGDEDGGPPSSVEAQVERLIQEATDPKNLCMLFSGWQPFL